MRFVIGLDEVGRAASKKRASPKSYVIGLDEVGRGCLAGPVVVAAAAIPAGWKPRGKIPKSKLKDSKKLSPAQRKLWFKQLTEDPALCYSIAALSSREVDRLNISQAANLAAYQAFQKLGKNYELPLANCRVYLDGGLFLGRRISGTKVECVFGSRTLVKADETFTAVKIASILAKFHRDRLMVRLAKKHPGYGFEVHKGYATPAHRKILLKIGPSLIHRLTFLRKYPTISK